jgi:hypothetical protein
LANEIKIRFVDKSGLGVVQTWPIELAKDVESISDVQKEKMGKDHFTACPGISDYRNQGWIMRAWTDIHVYASEKDTMIYYGDPHPDKKRDHMIDGIFREACPVHPMTDSGKGLSQDIPRHLPIKSDLMYPKPMHFTTPWAVESPDVSLALMPAYYHGDTAKKLHLYPGIIDINNGFNTMNMIACPVQSGKFVIRSGTPLMHIIPLQKGKFKSICQLADKNDMNKAQGQSAGTDRQWYRRLFMKKNKIKHIIDNVSNHEFFKN